ncbi:MAG: TonB-dependent receptor, partial [Polyangiaceae bacterium]|nr:TonB-dependent receptor [Polyangiaceae bacterium]
MAQEEPSPAVAQEAVQPRVVPPKLLKYNPPIYPDSAFSAGVEAKVRLSLTVTVEGTVETPEVTQSAGDAFDQAALDAALGLRFSPAMVDGEARAVRIGFEYDFSIAEVEKPEPLESLPPLGNLSGQLMLSGSEVPLPGVEVILRAAGKEVLRARTDPEGRFSFPDLEPGKYTISAEADGFIPLSSAETVEARTDISVLYRVVPVSDELEVLVEGERPPREVTKRTIERREISRIPGTSGDALRSIQSLPGVARPPGLAGLLIVRGSSPQDTRTFIDLAEVPLIYHFGGLSSVVPTEMLDRIDFYPGNFSVRYGRAQGGIVDVGLRSPNTKCFGPYGTPTDEEGCYHGMAQVDLIDARLMASGPVPGTEEWSWAAAGRRSWLDSWLGPVLEQAGQSVTNAPVYYDYQFIVERNLSQDDRLSFRFIGSDDRFKTLITSPAATDPGVGGNLQLGTAFYRGQVYYRKALTERATVEAMVSAGKDVIDFQLGGNLNFQINSYPVTVRSELGYQIFEGGTLNTGFDFEVSPFDVFVRAPPPQRAGQPASGPLATQIPIEQSASGVSFRPSWYGDLEWNITDRLRFVPGLRVDYARDTGQTDISPRANVRYTLVTADSGYWFGLPLATVLKAGIGKYSQPPQFQESDEIFGTPDVTSNQSMHYALGVEQDLTEKINVSLEGFYKDLYNSVTPGTVEQPPYTNDGSGYVVGMETLLKYKPGDRFFGWVAYTLSRSTRKTCASCDTTLFQYD